MLPLVALTLVSVFSTTLLRAGSARAASLVLRDTVSAPHFVIYSNGDVDGVLPDVSKVKGYNVFILSFLLSTGPSQQALNWANLDDATRTSLKKSYNDAGIKLLVSAFGSLEQPLSSGVDAETAATNLAAQVKQYGFDGIDIDFEDYDAMDKDDGTAVAWLTTLTKTLRNELPKDEYILTHTPVPWWFASVWNTGGYRKVNENVGDLIDWYNIMFYNQETGSFEDCDSLLHSAVKHDSVMEIKAAGIPVDKLVIGKPARQEDVNNGYMSSSTLASCLSTAKGEGWSAGVMVWQYPYAVSTWISEVRAQSWPVS